MLQAAAAILRCGAEILLVRQAAPGEEPHWALPGGVLEDGELATEGLTREVQEETGLTIDRSCSIAFIAQVDVLRGDTMFERGYHVTVWTFEVDAWSGDLGPCDPDELVSEARFFSLPEAVARLDASGTHRLTVRYLCGEITPGTLVFQRWHSDGRVEDVG